MIPLLELHLTSLTIGIEQLESKYDVWEMLNTRYPDLSQLWTNSMKETGAVFPPEYTTIIDRYRQWKTYADIIELAAPMNCLVAPGLCNGKHQRDKAWCLRCLSLFSSQPPLPANTCNFRKTVLHLKKLHDDDRYRLVGRLRRLVFPYSVTSMLWYPTLEFCRC
jgi:hypothetical protein